MSAKKGLIIGVIITVVLILIPSYRVPSMNYNLAKIQYEGYNEVMQNCGSNPSDACLKSLCVGRGDVFCEGVNRKAKGECEEERLRELSGYRRVWQERTCDWRSYSRMEKPSIFILLIPAIGDGLDFFLMFRTVGLIVLLLVLVLPAIIGYLIGKKFES